MLVEAAEAGGQLVLTGGSTPKRAYELAAERGADWSGATVWFSDERCVPPDDPNSNFGMADGSVRFIKQTIDQRTYNALGSRRGGEVISADAY